MSRTVPPVWFVTVMLTVPLLPIGWLVFVPVSATSTSRPEGVGSVFSVAIASAGTMPVDVWEMPPGGASTAQPHCRFEAVLIVSTMHESVIVPTRKISAVPPGSTTLPGPPSTSASARSVIVSGSGNGWQAPGGAPSAADSASPSDGHTYSNSNPGPITSLTITSSSGARPRLPT